MRFVFLCHSDSWSVNRDLLDVVCSYFELDPRVLVGHLDYPGAIEEKHCPGDFRSKMNNLSFSTHPYPAFHPWELGGDLTSPFDEHVGHSFRFCYREAGMTVIPKRGASDKNGK